jgi:HEAT repeat protein
MASSDPVVADVAMRTMVQILRFRAVRSAELDLVRAAVHKLVKIKDPSVVPVLIEILKNPRQGYLLVDGNLQEGSNGSSRLQALIALVEWRTKEAQDAIRTRRLDRDPDIVNAAERALEAFPGDWSGNPG